MKKIIPLKIENSKALCEVLGHYNFADLEDVRVGVNINGQVQIIELKILDDIVAIFLDSKKDPYLSVNHDTLVKEQMVHSEFTKLRFTIPQMWQKNIGIPLGMINIVLNNAFIDGIQIAVDGLEHSSAILIHFDNEELVFFTVRFTEP